MRTLVLTGLLFLLPTCVLADWGLPTNLGPLVNSDADEFGLSLSNDGAILYFDSDRPGGVGGKDLYLSRRSGGQWQGAENLGPQVNTSAREYCPSVSPDGLQLLFTTEGFNIHVSTFDGEQWLAGETLGPPVNTPAPEWAARFGAVAETIYFTAFEREPGTGHDILSSIRIGQAWGTPASLGFNSAAHEYAPFVVAGADSMLLVVDGDIHVSHWDGSAWTPPTVLPGGINHPDYYDTCPVLSASGDTIYFASERPGGEGGYDLWYSVWTGGAMDVEEIPDPAFHLSQNRPNPFHPRTLIRFSLVTADQATLTIYDTSGRLLRTLLDGPVGQGPTSVEWDGTDDAGRAVASGVYLYRLKTRTASLTRRLVLAR